MANELNVRADFIGGTITNNPLAIGDTTLNSAELSLLPAIGTTQFAKIILDPDGVNGTPEVVYVTAHTAGATSATILRGQETDNGGSVARAHVSGTNWIHGPTAADFGDLAWTNYTPTWKNGAGTTIDIGNGVLEGSFFLLGKTCFFRMGLVIGSTTALGTNTEWRFGLPPNCVTVGRHSVPVFMDPGGGSRYHGAGRIDNGSNEIIRVAVGATGGNLGYNLPFTWGDGDFLMTSGILHIQ